MRLFKTILLLMLVASIVPTVMVGWLSVSDTRELLVRDAQELAQERVKQLRLKTEGFLAEPTRAVMGWRACPASSRCRWSSSRRTCARCSTRAARCGPHPLRRRTASGCPGCRPSR